MTLDALMLASPLPGLINFTSVGPGATNGPLTAQTLGSYSNDPQQVEHLFDEYSSEPGFAGWIKTWQDSAGTSQVVEIAIRFNQASEAQTNASAFVSTLSKGSSGGASSNVSSIPGARAFTIDEPASTSGNIAIPAQQVQAVVFADGKYLIALHTDSPNGPGSHPIAAGTAVALALQQYQILSPATVVPKSSKSSGKRTSAAGSTILVVGLSMLGAVALVIAVLAALSWRRRKSGAHRVRTIPAPSRRIASGSLAANIAADDKASIERASIERASIERAGANIAADVKTTGPDGGRRWPETLGVPNSQSIGPTRTRRTPQSDSEKVNDRVKKRVSIGRFGRISREPAKREGDQQLVEAGAPNSRGSRSQRITNSRNKHPSASVALARARPPTENAGWYNDPTDNQKRRIRYWDGNSWTSHVAEPEI